MSLSKTEAIESNSNPQFMIAVFKLLKEKTLSKTTAFAKHTNLGINLTEKLNSSFFFPHKHYFSLKLIKLRIIQNQGINLSLLFFVFSSLFY